MRRKKSNEKGQSNISKTKGIHAKKEIITNNCHHCS